MPFYTANGLKIRLDPDAIRFMLLKHGLFPSHGTSEIGIDMNDVEMNTELWMSFPQAVSNVLMIACAAASLSSKWAISAALLGYVLGHLASNVSYSPFWRRLLPQFLGSWIVSLLAAIVVGVVSWSYGNWTLAVVVLMIVVLNWLRLTDTLELVLLPIGIFLRRTVGIGVGRSPSRVR